MQTTIRIDRSTLDALRLAAAELETATRRVINTNDQAVAALVAHWDSTKRDAYAITAPPALQPQGAHIA